MVHAPYLMSGYSPANYSIHPSKNHLIILIPECRFLCLTPASYEITKKTGRKKSRPANRAFISYICMALRLVGSFATGRIKLFLTQPDRERSNLHQFVV